MNKAVVDLDIMGKKSREAARLLSQAPTARRNAFLATLADLLQQERASILRVNAQDVERARQSGVSEALLDRLSLAGRLDGIIQDVLHVSTLSDPVGEVFEQRTLPNGLKVHKLRTPLGVLGVIYEARPNVTIDIACLAVKSANAVILRGGSETLATNALLVGFIRTALQTVGLPADAVQLIESADRGLILELIQLDKYVDMIIPRGGKDLQELCKRRSSIPVITGGIGICHIYLDSQLDLPAALSVIYNAKIQRPAACNALDTLLVHESIADVAIPAIIAKLSPAGVSFHLDAKAQRVAAKMGSDCDIVSATDADWDSEWLSLNVNMKIVDSIEEALAHIAKHSLSHSDAIMTSNKASAAQFVASVDSACVYINASTRFTDGGALGLGAEVAVTTQKLHARGPMGLKELTTYKWIVEGDYHIRE